MMDFGSKPENRPKIKRKINKKPIVLLLSLLTVAGLAVVYTQAQAQNPLPTDIKEQIAYRAIYPSKQSQLSSDYVYHADQKTLSFSLSMFNTKIAFTEQPAPASLGSGNQIYYPAIGIHPYAQFQTKLGPVALTKFWQTSTLDPAGQSGFLVSNGTMLIAHPDKDLSNDQWKQLFDSLKIAR